MTPWSACTSITWARASYWSSHNSSSNVSTGPSTMTLQSVLAAGLIRREPSVLLLLRHSELGQRECNTGGPKKPMQNRPLHQHFCPPWEPSPLTPMKNWQLKHHAVFNTAWWAAERAERSTICDNRDWSNLKSPQLIAFLQAKWCNHYDIGCGCQVDSDVPYVTLPLDRMALLSLKLVQNASDKNGSSQTQSSMSTTWQAPGSKQLLCSTVQQGKNKMLSFISQESQLQGEAKP